MAKRIMLTMADELFSALESRRKAHGYMTIQETINDLVRKGLLAGESKAKAGRPKKFEFEDLFSRPTKESRKIEGG